MTFSGAVGGTHPLGAVTINATSGVTATTFQLHYQRAFLDGRKCVLRKYFDDGRGGHRPQWNNIYF